MKKLVLLGLVSAFLVGCASQKDYVATGGSKADGTVELSYEYNGFEVPKTNENQGLALAKKRCEAWGYKNAEKFGGKKTACSIPAGLGGCNVFIDTVQYQCLDK